MSKKKITLMFYLWVITMYCQPTDVLAVQELIWAGPGNLYACEGDDVQLVWNFGDNKNITVYGYTFCVSYDEHNRCQIKMAYKPLGSEHYAELNGFEGRTKFISSERNGMSQNGIVLCNVTSADSARYSIWEINDLDRNQINTDCRLTVIKDIRNISILVYNASDHSVQSDNLDPDTPYFVDVLYSGSYFPVEVVVTLSVNGNESRTLCTSPCRFNQTFVPGNVTLVANVSAVDCFNTSGLTLTVAERELQQTSLNNISLAVAILSGMLLVVITVATVGIFRWCKTKRKGQHQANADAVSQVELSSPLNPIPNLRNALVQSLREDLIKCYSRPEFRYLNPFLNEDTLGYFIDSVFVDVSLAKQTIEPIVGKHGLEDSIRQTGAAVSNVSDMIPAPGGQRVLLTGFVGSGKTSLCLHWVFKWSQGMSADSKLDSFELIVFLRARALEKSIQQSMVNLLEGVDPQSNQKEREINKIFGLKPSILIIIDGYDEAMQEQKDSIDNIISYKILPHASVIVTSRPNFFYGKIDKWYDNLGFKQEQQLAFIKQFKLIIKEDQVQHFETFEHKFLEDKNAGSIFISPMMAMTTCSMVAAGEVVSFESRVKNYQQLTDFLDKRACFKNKDTITHELVKQARPDLCRAAYNQMLKQKVFHFTRNELLKYTTSSILDTIIIHLGYMSITKYILSYSIDTAYTFVHKSWAEFIAAQHVMTLDISDRCEAVCQLFKSGLSNLEVLRFTMGLCSEAQPDNVAVLFKAIFNIFITDLDINDEVLQQETETIKAGLHDRISHGSRYLLLLLTDVDPRALPGAAARDLSRVCAAVRRAEIGEEAVRERAGIDVSHTDDDSARALYAGLLLTAHRTQGSLHTVQEVRVWCKPNSPHSAITRLPATLAACAPSMTILTQVEVWQLVSSTELGEVCDGLAASGLPCLTHLTLGGDGDLYQVAGADLGPVVRVIRTAAQLRGLVLGFIHCGKEDQIGALCAAVGEAAPQLTLLVLRGCSVSAQQYSALLLPALRERLTARGARLGKVSLWLSGTMEEKKRLKQKLQEVADTVSVQ